MITKAIHDLCRTSLVSRGTSNKNGRENFHLHDQVRELLRFHPKRIEVRQKVEKYLRTLRAQVTNTPTATSSTRYEWDFVDSNWPEDLKVIAHKVNIATKKSKSSNSRLPDVYRQLMHSEADFAGISAYWRFRAKVLRALQDSATGFDCLAKALELDDADVVSKQLLAHWLIQDQRPDEALPYLENLISTGADDPNLFGENFSSCVISDYLYAKIFLKKFDEVASATKDWLSGDSKICWIKATARIRCYLRWSEDSSSD
ncbi:MAG: hypothetical protein Q8P42_13075 [Gallionella sp.]|nr:hypothetical protein [Gallionella sp.]